MLVLLDIDGVMVSAASWKKTEILDDEFSSFSKRAVDGLRLIISETGASIVLTTSHKSRFTIPEWINIFKRRGVDASSLKTLGSNTKHLSRKDEILNWLRKNRTRDENFVIIDDDKSLNDLPVEIKERCVITDSMIGLNENKAKNAIDILKKHNKRSRSNRSK